jgi:O-antigen/teichoic acid export membrane protein
VSEPVRKQPPNEVTLVKGIAILLGGSLSAQLLVLLAAPVLTRLFQPDEFGTLAIYASLIAIVTSVSCLRYQLAIPLPENDEDALAILGLCVFLIACTAGISTALTYIFLDTIFAKLNVRELTSLKWLIPISIGLAGLYEVFSFWAIRSKQFTAISVTKIYQAITTLGIQILGYKFGVFSLLVGHTAGLFGGLIGLAKRTLEGKANLSIIFPSAIRMARRYRRFPIYSTWAALIQTLTKNLPALLLAGLSGTAASGFFLLAERILSTPVSVLQTSVSNGVHSHLADSRRSGTIAIEVEKLISPLIRLSVAPAIGLMVIVPHIVSSIFGQVWQEAGQYVFWLTPYIFIGLIFAPMTSIIPVMEWQKHGLIYHSLSLACTTGSLMIGLYHFDPLTAIAAYGIARFSLILVYRTFLLVKLGCNLTPIINLTLRNLFFFGILGSALSFILTDKPENWLLLGTGVFVLSLIVYLTMNFRHFHKTTHA